MPHPREEIEAAVERYVAMRAAIEAGEDTWTSLAGFFTDDAVFIDPAWGRVEGIDELKVFLDESMRGLEDWRFPIEFTAIDGDHVAIKWTQILPGARPDGTPYQQSGWSHLLYAGDGRFRYEEDSLNMAHVLEDLKDSGWRPGEGFMSPPRDPNRDWSHT